MSENTEQQVTIGEHAVDVDMRAEVEKKHCEPRPGDVARIIIGGENG